MKNSKNLKQAPLMQKNVLKLITFLIKLWFVENQQHLLFNWQKEILHKQFINVDFMNKTDGLNFCILYLLFKLYHTIWAKKCPICCTSKFIWKMKLYIRLMTRIATICILFMKELWKFRLKYMLNKKLNIQYQTINGKNKFISML